MIMKLYFLLLVTLISGCANEARIQPEFPGEKVALVPAHFTPALSLNTYAEGKGAAAATLGAEGAGEGALIGAVVPIQMGPLGIALYPFIAPFTIIAGTLVGGVVGASTGAIHGLPADQAAITRKLAQDALGNEGVQLTVGKLIESMLRQRGHNVFLVSDHGPIDKADFPGYADLAGMGVDGVLEVAVMSLGMAATKGTPPRISLEVKLRTRIISPRPNQVPYERILEYWSRPRPVEDWIANSNELLIDQIKTALDALAQDTADVYYPIPLAVWWKDSFRDYQEITSSASSTTSPP
ncbi:MAG: hypothetical protein FIA96_17625 [Betaproteobacteria bacterium]|nr:hypothetical protein [Betaproteobacteria bacterium]